MTEKVKKKPTNVEDVQEMVRIASNMGIGNVGICTTAANTAAKKVTLGSTFELVDGATMIVTFQNAITVAGATIAVTHTPLGESAAVTEVAKPIYYRGAALGANLIKAGMMVQMRYNGTQWDIISNIEDLNDYLQVNAQNFSDAQKQQARTNIDAQEKVTDMSKLGNGIGTCSTSSGTALEVVLSDYNLVKNSFVAVTFENDVPANATLNINGKGAKSVYHKGAAIQADIIKAGDTVIFGFDGTNYVLASLGGGDSSVDGTITVSLVPVVSGSQYAASLLNGVTVELFNVSDNKTVETKTWAGSQLSFTKIMAAKTYKLKYLQKYGYTTPQDSQEFVLGVGETYNVGTVEYTADKYVLNVSTNQSDDTDLESTVIRVSATGISADGYLDFTGSQTDLEVLVPKGTTPTAACSSGQPSANNYKQTITVVAATNPSDSTPTAGSITAIYETEILTVSITKDSGSGDMSTPTITVKNGNTTIGTLHNGDSLKIAYSINYVCTASKLEEYSTPASVTKNWANTTAKSLSFLYEEEKGIDLGLPSGRKWAEANVGATNAWEIGLYFSWGNVIGHAEGSGYNFDQNTYNSTPGAALTGDIAVGTTYDAARAIMGGSWRMPTKDEFQELYDNTDSEWVADYHGIAGRKFMKKTDHNVFIFLPAAGGYNGATLGNRGSRGYYWSRSIHSNASNGYYLFFLSSAVYPQSSNYRYVGFPVRAVQ